MNELFDVVVVGAGLSGIMAARQLTVAGKSVVLLDKGISPGGRLATRRIGAGKADHGAQFFTVRSPEMQALAAEWLHQGWVFEWSRGWAGGSLSVGPMDGYPRYAACDGFNSLAKQLAWGLDVRLSTQVKALKIRPSGSWQAFAEDDSALESRAVILTAPVPQSLALLADSQIMLAGSDREKLQSISYAPCLCGLFLIEGEVELPAPGALQRPGQPISWIADNQRKGISPEAKVLTVHAGPEASRLRWRDDEASILGWMVEELRSYFAAGTRVQEAQLKRWRYALPANLHPERSILAEIPSPLIFAGDAFGEPRVEGAVLSGLAAAATVLATV